MIAPFFVGDPAAPRFTGPGDFPSGPDNRMFLAEVRQIGDVIFARYLPGDEQRLSTLTLLSQVRGLSITE